MFRAETGVALNLGWGWGMRRRNYIKVFATSAVARRLMTHTFIAIVVAFLFNASWGYAQNANPFSKYGGNWTGSGLIHLSNETKERIRCRATFTPTEMINTFNLKIELRCAGDSYNFDVQSDLNYDSGTISGPWNENNLGINGMATGTINGDNIRAVIESLAFNATFELMSQGDKQQIRIQSPGSEISAVFIFLNRNSR
jgi:hypothetical protein